MILPTKHMPQERALLTIGSHILKKLNNEKTVSALWEEIIADNNDKKRAKLRISYDWFVLALDLLYTMNAIKIREGKLSLKEPS